MPPGIDTSRRSQNALKPMEKLQQPSNLALRNDEILHIPKVLQCFLKSVRRTFWPLQMPPGIQLFARSPNAIISNEKSPKPLNSTPQNDEIINISQVL